MRTLTTKKFKAPLVTFTFEASPRTPQHITDMNKVLVEAYNSRKPAYRLINLDSGEVSYSVAKPQPNKRVEVERLSLSYIYADLTDTLPNPD